jgi:four helix bundle protein
MSIPLNIAEGSGKYTRDQKRFYLIARGSTLECGAILDVLAVVDPSLQVSLHPARELLHRIAAMLTRLSLRNS